MRLREKKLTDHGVWPEDEERIKEYCLHVSGEERELLRQSCERAAPGLERQIFDSLVKRRNGYDAQMKTGYIPATKADFYAYQRKALGEFYRWLMWYGKWGD